MAANIEIYTWSYCPYCLRAKGLLERKNVEYQEHCVDDDEATRDEMTQRANGRSSLPQIFINDRHIGGCDDLYALENEGELDSLLEGSVA